MTSGATPATAALGPYEWAALMPRPPLLSSERSGWRNIALFRFRHPGRGMVATPPLSTHLIVCHLASPSDVSQRLNGPRRAGHSLPGEIMIMSANQPSEWTWENGPDVLHLYLDAALLRQAAQEAGCSSFDLNDGVCLHDPGVARIGLDLMGELQSPGIGGDLYADVLGQTLALQLLRHHSSAGRSPALAAGALAPFKLRRVQDYIEADLACPLTLDALAEVAAVSPFHFARAFKQATGETPHAYVVQRRIARAKVLLRDGELPLVEVALAVGFASQAHFTTVFQKHCGVTPKKFREVVKA